MNSSNPYAVPETLQRMPAHVRLRNQQLFRQAALFSAFYFVGFAFVVAVVSGIRSVPQFFSENVVTDFSDVWLPELMFVLVPYLMLRIFTVGWWVRPSWWSFCVAGTVTFPFLTVYTNLLLRHWDTPSIYNIGAHILSVVSAMLTELLAIALLGWLGRRGQNAEQNAEPELPITGS
jgi:hypothetical protein